MREKTALLTATELQILGFENVAQWAVVTGPVTLANSTTFKSEGAKSLSMSGMQYATVRNSVAITKDGTPAPSVVGFDLRVPTTQPNPTYHGAVELYVNAPSAGVNNQFLGSVALFNVPKGSFQRINFNVPTAVRNGLNGANYTDLRFTIGLNVPAGAQTHYIDKFTLGPVSCTPVSDNNVCTTDTCSPSTGQTTYTPVAAGTSCTDSNACNGAEACNGAGVCQAGTPPVVDDGNVCTTDACTPAAGVTHVPVAVGTSCSDANVCNGAEACTAAGVCQAGTAPVVDDGNACTVDACAPATGVTHTAVATGASCTDGNACNGTESCNAAGTCQAGTAPTVDDGNVCTTDSCSPAGGITHVAVAAGTSCADSNACNGAETCNAAGTCQAGTAPTVDDGNVCTADSCSPGAGVTHVAVAAGTGCSDANACNGEEACTASGTCQPGAPPVLDDDNACTTDSCSAAGGVAHVPVAAGSGCDGSGNQTPATQQLTVSVPCGVELTELLASATSRLVVDDRSTLGVPGQLAVVAAGNGGLEFGAGVQARVDAVSLGASDLLRSQSHVFGSITTAGTVVQQDNVVVGGVVREGSPSLFTTTTWNAEWPGGTSPNLSFPPDSPNVAVLPGAYGAIHAYSRATFTLTAGTYFVNSLVLEPQVHFRVDTSLGPVLIYVRDALTLNVGIESVAGEAGQVLLGYLGTATAVFREALVASVVAPNSTIELHRPNSGLPYRGSFFGKAVHVFSNATVQHLPLDWDTVCAGVGCQKSGSCGEPQVVECAAGETARVVDVRGEASALWHGKETATTGRALSINAEFELEFDREVQGDHPMAWFRAIDCEDDIRAEAVRPTIPSKTLTLRPQVALTRGCTYRLMIAWYQALGPDGACLDESFELEFRVAALNDPHDFALAQREGGDGPLSYFLVREGVNVSPEDAFLRYESEIGVADLDLRRDKRFELPWRDKTQWSFVQHVNGYPVRGAGYTVEVVGSGADEKLHSASGHLVAEVDVADSPTISEATARSTALGAAGLNAAAWTTLPVGKLLVWASPPATLGAPTRYALAWKFSFSPTDLQDPSVALEFHTAWVDATTSELLELESANMGDTYVDKVPGSVQYQNLGPLPFTAAKWELSAGGTEFRVNGPRISNYVDMRDGYGVEATTADPDGNAYWEVAEGDAARAALLMQTAQASRPFIAGLNLLGGWKGFDGEDSSFLKIWFYPPGVLPPDDEGVHVLPLPSFAPGQEVVVHYGYSPPHNNDFEVLPHVLVHELGHLIGNNSRTVAGKEMVARTGDPRAIQEGIADAFGITYAHNVLGDPYWSTNPQFEYFPTGDIDERDIRDPWITEDARQVGDQYFSGNPYTNSTVISRWAYLLGTGDNTIVGACNMPVSQLVAGNVSESLVRVLQIASDAFFEVSTTPSFVELREKTEEAALRLYDKTTATRVSEAWMAVGVGGAGHAALTKFAPAPVSNLHPWKVQFSWEGLDKDWEMQVATSKAELDDADVLPVLAQADGTVRRDVALEPDQKYWWRARVLGAQSWAGCALIESSFETAEVPIELAAIRTSLPWTGKKNEVYETGYRGLVSWMHVPGAEYDLFFGGNSEPACSGSPVATTRERFATLEPWDDYWSTSDDRDDGVLTASFTPDIDELSDEVHTIGIRPRPWNSTVEGKCYEFRAHKRIIEHFTQDWPQLEDSHPNVTFDPDVTRRDREPAILPPPDFRFSPSSYERPGPAVPAVEAYRLVMWRTWDEEDGGRRETLYNEVQDVEGHPKLTEGKWEFAEASYDWLGKPADKPEANRYQSWQLYAVVDGQERPAAHAPGPYEFIDPPPNQVLWGASDLPPGHFIWPDTGYGEHFIKSAASWDDIAASRRIEEVDGEDRVVYTVDWTLEIDSFWEKHGVPVYAGSPAGPMSGYYLEVYGRGSEVGRVEVTAENFKEAGFGGKVKGGDRPRFNVEEDGTTSVAAVAVATPFNREGDDVFWAGDPTMLEFNVHWVDEDEDSTICGGRGEQCCYLDNDSCDWGECGQDEEDTCSGCGRDGEACCDNDVCESGAICEGSECKTIPRCDGLVREGGNFGETVPVAMGPSSGRASFVMHTKFAPDRMTLRDQTGRILLPPACVGTDNIEVLANECFGLGVDLQGTCYMNDGSGIKCLFADGLGNRTCIFPDGWQCHIDTGDCSHLFEYSGGSTVTVEVEPNCAGTTDTYWAFEVRCP